MNEIEKMKELIKELNEASVAYYKFDKPIMSDKQYDSFYDALKLLEDETGVLCGVINYILCFIRHNTLNMV